MNIPYASQEIGDSTTPLDRATSEKIISSSAIVEMHTATDIPSHANSTPLADSENAGAKNKAYNQYACIRCRRLKKKCSKELPRCANCEKQGESCEYVERKNKRKSLLNQNSVSVLQLKKQRPSTDSNDSNNTNILDKEPELKVASQSDTDSLEIPALTVNSIPISPSFPNQSNIFHTKSTANNDTLLLSPKSSNTRSPPLIQLPPIRNRSTSMNHASMRENTLPSLSFYSLQQPALPDTFPKIEPRSVIPPAPRQILASFPGNYSSTTFPSSSYQLQGAGLAARQRSSSKSSNRSISPSDTQRANTFLVPPKQVMANDELSSLAQVGSLQFNSLFEVASPNSIEYDLLILVFNKSEYIDKSIFSTFMNHNMTSAYKENFLTLLKLVIFLDKKLMLTKFKAFEENRFNWECNDQTSEDYFTCIEFLLLFTCSIILVDSRNNKIDSGYHKFTVTMAYKLLQKKVFPITNIQILRLMMIFQIISLIGKTDMDTIWFIQSFLSKYSLKWMLNRNVKNTGIKGVTLSELEYANRLFWAIFISDSLISSTTGQQPSFNLSDIDVPLPIAITKDEETKVIAQRIVINMCKIQSKIISELYTVNSRLETNNDSERFNILSGLRQDSDLWYNECRILLSSLAEMLSKAHENNPDSRSASAFKSEDSFGSKQRDNSGITLLDRQKELHNTDVTKIPNNTNYRTGNSATDKINELTDNFNLDLQNFAAWISAEYYYTLTILFKPSNLFPKPDIPNFTVISNATYQNTLLLKNLMKEHILPRSYYFFGRYANTTLYILISIVKGMFSLKDCEDVMDKMLEIWALGTCDFSKALHYLITEIDKLLTPIFQKSNQNRQPLEFFRLDESRKLILELIKSFVRTMAKNSFSIAIDLQYLESVDFHEL